MVPIILISTPPPAPPHSFPVTFCPRRTKPCFGFRCYSYSCWHGKLFLSSHFTLMKLIPGSNDQPQKQGWRFSALFSLRSFTSTSLVSLKKCLHSSSVGLVRGIPAPPLITAGASSPNALFPERNSQASSWNPGCHMPQPHWNRSSGAKALRSFNHLLWWPWLTLHFTILSLSQQHFCTLHSPTSLLGHFSRQRPPSSFACLSRTIIVMSLNHCSFTCVQLCPPPKG